MEILMYWNEDVEKTGKLAGGGGVAVGSLRAGTANLRRILSRLSAILIAPVSKASPGQKRRKRRLKPERSR